MPPPKAGVLAMSKSLAQEVASRNITVNCVAPGLIETPMTEKLNDEQRSKILVGVPAGRMGKPQEVAAGVLLFGITRSRLYHRHNAAYQRRRRYVIRRLRSGLKPFA